MTYTASVERDGRVWFVQVDGVGATQARHLRELEEMTEDLIAVMGKEPGEVVYEFKLPPDVAGHLERARELREESAQAQSQAATEVRIAARQLADSGLTLRDIGRLLGISHQRAAQLLN